MCTNWFSCFFVRALELSEIMEPVQCYFLSRTADNNTNMGAGTLFKVVMLFWSEIDFSDGDNILEKIFYYL